MRTCALMVPFLVAATLASAGCGSNPEPDDSLTPTAPPIAADLNKASKSGAEAETADPRSPSRVLAYVEGDVITYREIRQLIGPELAQLEDADEKARREDQALLSIVRDRLLFRAATDASVKASREEIDAERAEFVKSLAKNGGTLDAYLHEHEMSRREFDEMISMQLIVAKYRRAAIGHNSDASVRVRPVTDTYVPPEDVEKYYERHPEKFREVASAKVRMLTIKTDLEAPDRAKAVADAKARAAGILTRLRSGEDWVPVFRKESVSTPDPDHPDGLEEFGRGAKAPWIEEFAFGKAKGTLSDVIQQGTTFYILRAEGSHDERTVPFDEAAPGIRRMLSELRSRMAWLEVELNVLDESSLEPEALRSRLRDTLRQARLQLIATAGI